MRVHQSAAESVHRTGAAVGIEQIVRQGKQQSAQQIGRDLPNVELSAERQHSGLKQQRFGQRSGYTAIVVERGCRSERMLSADSGISLRLKAQSELSQQGHEMRERAPGKEQKQHREDKRRSGPRIAWNHSNAVQQPLHQFRFVPRASIEANGCGNIILGPILLYRIV